MDPSSTRTLESLTYPVYDDSQNNQKTIMVPSSIRTLDSLTYLAVLVHDDSECDQQEQASSNKTFQVAQLEMRDNLGNVGSYTGSLLKKSQLPHGQGLMEYDDMAYDGQWVEGDWCGYGKLTIKSSGDFYQGRFFDNMKNGLGAMKYFDGRTYDGTFQCDFMGKGIMRYPNGSEYWGYWDKHGKRHGRGKFVFADGRVYDGEFSKDEMEGHGRLTWPDGRWYLGEVSQGIPNGLGMQVLADGKLNHEGTFCNGNPITCSSFESRRISIGSVLLFRSSSERGISLVGPIPYIIPGSRVLGKV
jgi:hypothetical protein